MLKKAGMVVLGATAGMLSLAPLASAGEAGHHDGGHHGQHESHSGGADCGASAVSGGQGNSGSQLIGANNINLQAPINQLGVLSRQDDDCGGHHGDGHRGGHHGGHGHGHGRDGGDDGDGGGDVAFSQGNRLISADNLLANADVSHVNVLATDNSE